MKFIHIKPNKEMFAYKGNWNTKPSQSDVGGISIYIVIKERKRIKKGGM